MATRFSLSLLTVWLAAVSLLSADRTPSNFPAACQESGDGTPLENTDELADCKCVGETTYTCAEKAAWLPAKVEPNGGVETAGAGSQGIITNPENSGTANRKPGYGEAPDSQGATEEAGSSNMKPGYTETAGPEARGAEPVPGAAGTSQPGYGAEQGSGTETKNSGASQNKPGYGEAPAGSVTSRESASAPPPRNPEWPNNFPEACQRSGAGTRLYNTQKLKDCKCTSKSHYSCIKRMKMVGSAISRRAKNPDQPRNFPEICRHHGKGTPLADTAKYVRCKCTGQNAYSCERPRIMPAAASARDPDWPNDFPARCKRSPTAALYNTAKCTGCRCLTKSTYRCEECQPSKKPGY